LFKGSKDVACLKGPVMLSVAEWSHRYSGRHVGCVWMEKRARKTLPGQSLMLPEQAGSCCLKLDPIKPERMNLKILSWLRNL